MRILPITNNSTNNQQTFHGYLQEQTSNLVLGMGKGFADGISKQPTSISNFVLSQRMALVYNNLNTIMERFARGAMLSFVKLKDNCTHRFYIEHPDSNYKCTVKDIQLSENYTKPSDVDRLETLVVDLSKVNPFEKNSQFILQRKQGSHTDLFEPDADFVNIEDRLVIADKNKLEGMSVEDTMSYFKNLGEGHII